MVKITHFSDSNKMPLRLYPTERCNYACRIHSSYSYCDHYQTMKKDAELHDFVKIAQLFYNSNLSEIVKISGREPTLYPQLLDLIRELKRVYSKITLSSNGSGDFSLYKAVIDAGVTHISISLNSLDSKKYAFHIGLNQTQGEDYFKNVIKNLKALSKENVILHLNRIIMKNFNNTEEDFTKYFEFSREINACAKIFDFNFHPHLNMLLTQIGNKKPELNNAVKVFHENYVDLSAFYKQILDDSLDYAKFENNYSNRILYKVILKDKTSVMFDITKKKSESNSFCQNCSYKDVCKEGFYSNGWEIFPDLTMKKCPINPKARIKIPPVETIKNIKFHKGEIIFE